MERYPRGGNQSLVRRERGRHKDLTDSGPERAFVQAGADLTVSQPCGRPGQNYGRDGGDGDCFLGQLPPL